MIKHVLDKKGMTLVELLAVIVILGIISAIAVVEIGNVIQKSKDNAFVGSATVMKEAATLYFTEAFSADPLIEQKVTYIELETMNFIEIMKDPYTNNKLIPNEDSYVVLSGKKVIAVCLRGEEKNLCSYKNIPGEPIPVDELNTINITVNTDEKN